MSDTGNKLISGTPKQILVIPFMAAVPANTNLTLLAGKIPFWYRVIECEIVFRDDAANNLLIYVFASKSATLSTTIPPPDTNIFSQYSQTPYFIGEGLIKTVSCNYLVENGDYYLKVYASNLNAYAQTVNVTVKIEEV
jgi:hypothetical protein